MKLKWQFVRPEDQQFFMPRILNDVQYLTVRLDTPMQFQVRFKQVLQLYELSPL